MRLSTLLRFAVPLGVLIAVGLAPGARAQFELGTPVPAEVVAWSATMAPPQSAAGWTESFAPGERAFVTVKARVHEGWRLYALGSPGGLPLQFRLDALPDWVELVGVPAQTPPHDAYDPVLEEAYQYHRGEARIWQAVRIADDAPPGVTTVSGSIRFAACNDQVCLPPRDVPFRARLTVRPRGSR